VYYESSFFDDSRKRDVYAPSHFILPPTGHLKVYSAEVEKNWFLMNHPGNFQNPVRNHESRPYARVLIQFHTHDPNEKAKRRQERTAYLYKVLGYVQSGLATSWKYHELVNACEVLVQEAGMRSLPYDLLNYKEFNEEEHEVLRAALADVAYNDALWVYTRLIEGKHTRIAEYLRLVKNTDQTGFGYDNKNHNFFFRAEDGENEKGEKKYKKGIFINVPDKKDPDKFLFDCCLTTPGFFERIIQIVEESKQKELA